jgi:sensor domain CHASE-containing protein
MRQKKPILVSCKPIVSKLGKSVYCVLINGRKFVTDSDTNQETKKKYFTDTKTTNNTSAADGGFDDRDNI